MAEPGGENDAERCALLRRCRDGGWDDCGRHGYDRYIWYGGQSVISFSCSNTFDLAVARIDEINCTRKAAATKVLEYRMAGR